MYTNTDESYSLVVIGSKCEKYAAKMSRFAKYNDL